MKSYMKKPVGMLKFKKAADVGLTYALLILVGIIFVFPCLWLVLASFSKTGSLYSFRRILPARLQLGQLQDAVYGYGDVQLSAMVSQHIARRVHELHHRDAARHPHRLHHLAL